jgi:hypothetical protein
MKKLKAPRQEARIPAPLHSPTPSPGTSPPPGPAEHLAGLRSTAARGSRRGRGRGGRRRRGRAAARTPAAGRPAAGRNVRTTGLRVPAARSRPATLAARPPCWGTARCAAATLVPSPRSLVLPSRPGPQRLPLSATRK